MCRNEADPSRGLNSVRPSGQVNLVADLMYYVYMPHRTKCSSTYRIYLKSLDPPPFWPGLTDHFSKFIELTSLLRILFSKKT